MSMAEAQDQGAGLFYPIEVPFMLAGGCVFTWQCVECGGVQTEERREERERGEGEGEREGEKGRGRGRDICIIIIDCMIVRIS